MDLQSITVTICYDKRLKKITGVDFENAVVNNNQPFLLMLFSIFQSHPEIEKKYPPGSLTLLLNGLPPTDFDLLKDKDIIKLAVYEEKRIIQRNTRYH